MCRGPFVGLTTNAEQGDLTKDESQGGERDGQREQRARLLQRSESLYLGRASPDAVTVPAMISRWPSLTSSLASPSPTATRPQAGMNDSLAGRRISSRTTTRRHGD